MLRNTRLIQNKLASYTVGTVVGSVSARVVVDHSTPPAFYTEASLLDAMVHAEQFAETERDKEILQACNGVGTASTRSEVINDLLQCGYVSLEKLPAGGAQGYRVKIEPLGALVNDMAPEELKSVTITARWELLFKRIERGEIKAKDFNQLIYKFVASLFVNIKNNPKTRQFLHPRHRA